MSDEKPSCAHARVTLEHAAAAMSHEYFDFWACCDCGARFCPVPVAADLSRMTLGELEATAERMGKAVATIREAQSLLGVRSSGGAGVTAHTAKAADGLATRVSPSHDDEEGPPPPRPEVPVDAVAAHRARQFQPPDDTVPRELRMPKPERPRFSAAEQRERAALRGQFSTPASDPNLPDDIAAMEQQGEPTR